MRGAFPSLAAGDVTIRRGRLLADLDAVDPGGISVIVAPAGCGASFLLQQYAEEQVRPCTLVRIGDGREPVDVDRLLAEMEPGADLVLDRLDHADPSTLDRVRRLLNEWVGPGRVVVSSRRRLPFIIAPGRLGSSVRCFGEGDLALDPDELAELSRRYGRGPTEDMVAWTGGWAGSLPLVSTLPAAALGGVMRRVDRALDGLDPASLRFLAVVAAVAPIRAALLDEVLGRDDVLGVLAEIRDCGVPMIETPSTSDGVVVISRLLTERLAGRLEGPDRDVVAAVVAGAAIVAEGRGELRIAFALHERSGARDAMADLCYRSADRLILSGEGLTLRSWLTRFDETERMADPRLWITWVHTIRPRYESAVQDWLADCPFDGSTRLPDGRTLTDAAHLVLVTCGLEAATEADVVASGRHPATTNRRAWQLIGEDRSTEARELLREPFDDAASLPVAEAMRLCTLALLASDDDEAEAVGDLRRAADAALAESGLRGRYQAFSLDLVDLRVARAGGDLRRADVLVDTIRSKVAVVGDGTKLERLAALAECAHHLIDRGHEPASIRSIVRECHDIVTSWTMPLVRFEREVGRLERRLAELPQRSPYGARDEVLTPPELRVVRLLCTHLTVPQIAAVLGVSVNTIKTHRAAVYRKLKVATRSDAVRVAVERGLASADDLGNPYPAPPDQAGVAFRS